MRISTKGDYALRALFDLAQQQDKGPVPSDIIAMRQGIPASYLHHLLIPLRRAGLIASLRGVQGGHLLARPPTQITLLDILVAVDGPFFLVERSRDDLVPTVPEDHVLVTMLWIDLSNQIMKSLAAITLDDLCQRKQQHQTEFMYYI